MPIKVPPIDQRLRTSLSVTERLHLLTDEVLKLRHAVGLAATTPAAGASTFIALTDTDPTTYASQAAKFVRVNAGETGLELHTLDLTTRAQWSAAASYTPTWTCELYGTGDVNYPTGAVADPVVNSGSITGYFKYNLDYLHIWGSMQAAGDTTFGLGRWVIGIPTSPAFSPLSTAYGIGGSCYGRCNNDDGSGTPGLSTKMNLGQAVWGGPTDRLPDTLDDGGATEIDMKAQSNAGIRLISSSTTDFWGVLDGGNGLPLPWEASTDTFFYWNVLIPLR